MAKQAGRKEGASRKTLFVFDFDHTLIDDNSDTWIMSLCPELNLMERLHTMRTEFTGWTKLMDHVFSLIHQQGRTKEDVVEHMKKVRLFEQSLKSISAVHESDNASSIIISDANVIFIDIIMEESGVKDMVGSVISNPAHFDESGRLRVEHYHSHDCNNCKRTPNLCKGKAVREYLDKNSGYDKVVYVGDGRNDLCPCLTLTGEDVVICRKGYALETELAKHISSCHAQVHVVDFTSELGDFIVSNILWLLLFGHVLWLVTWTYMWHGYLGGAINRVTQ